MPHNLLLADDDIDDCTFFKEALEDLPIATNLSTVHDGVQLMSVLSTKTGTLPDIVFLDLNMPLKNGFECLSAIRSMRELENLPVVIFSTSFSLETVDLLYNMGAHYYVRKPGEYNLLKKVILEAVTLTSKNSIQPPRDQFVLHP